MSHHGLREIFIPATETRPKTPFQAKKNEVKGIRISLRTGEHDLDVKVKQGKFIDQGNSVKVALIFRGREVTQYDLAAVKMLHIKEALKDVAKCDQEPKSRATTCS